MKQQEEKPTIRFKRCLIFFNPAGTHAETVKKRINEIKSILEPACTVTIIETSADGRKANATLVEKQHSQLSASTLVCIAAGDGTTNQIIETLVTSKHLSDKARLAPILPLWGGSANDLAHMLNGPAYRVNLKNLLTNGHIIPIHPLQCELVSKGKTKTHIAACYASFGATAFAAQKLNHAAHRHSKLRSLPGGKLLQEIITVLSAFVEAPSFAIKDSDKVHVVYERTFSNGSRMGKIQRLPVQLTDEMFYINTLENRKLVSIIPKLIESTRKRVSQKFLGNYTTFTTQEDSWAQFDGEPVEIASNTKVHVQLSPKPFYALSSNLSAPKTK